MSVGAVTEQRHDDLENKLRKSGLLVRVRNKDYKREKFACDDPDSVFQRSPMVIFERILIKLH